MTPNYQLAAITSSSCYSMFNLFSRFFGPLTCKLFLWDVALMWTQHFWAPVKYFLKKNLAFLASRFSPLSHLKKKERKKKLLPHICLYFAMVKRWCFYYMQIKCLVLPKLVLVLKVFPLTFALLFAHFIGNFNFQRRWLWLLTWSTSQYKAQRLKIN